MLRFCLAICLYLLVLSSLPGQTPILQPERWVRSDRHDGYVLGNGQMYVVAGLGKQLQRSGKSQLSAAPADYNRIAWIIGPSYTLGNLGYGWEPVPLLNQDTIHWTEQTIIQPDTAQRYWGVESQHPELSLNTRDMLLEGEAVFVRAMHLSRPANATPGRVRILLPVYPDPRNSSYAMFNGQVVDSGQVERWAGACGPNLKPRQSIPPEALREVKQDAGCLLLYGANHALWQEVSTTVPDEASYQQLFPYRAAATSVKCESPGSQIHLSQQGFEIDMGLLAPGESRWLYLYIATQQGTQAEAGARAIDLLQHWQEQDPATVFQQQEARQAPFLFTSKDGNPALLRSINACLNLSLACKPLDGGTMAQPYMYPMYYVRDQFGPYKLLLAAGEYAKALNILQFYIAKQNHEGIQNAHDLFVQTPDPSIWLPEANAKNGHHARAEVPSYIILMAQNYYQATGDLEGIRPFYPRLKYNLAVQQRSVNGILPFAGDESYTNRSETVPRYRAEMTDSHLLYLAAADFMQELATALGLAGDAQEFQVQYTTARTQLMSRMWLEAEKHFTYARDTSANLQQQDRRPAFDALLRWSYLELGQPHDSIARHNLNAVLRQLTEPIRVVPEFEWCAGMDPGYLLYALARSQHPQTHDAAKLLLSYASNQGLYSEYYRYADSSIIPEGGTLRPWESAINGYALIQYLTGLRLDMPNQHLSLQPHLPKGWTHWKSRPLPLYQEGSLLIELDKTDEEVVCRLQRKGGAQELQLDLEFGLFGTTISSSDPRLRMQAGRKDLLQAQIALPADSQLTFRFNILEAYADE